MRSIRHYYGMFTSFLFQRWVLWTLFTINFAGTIYGYIWYGNQLAETPARFLIFVPDSPTASAFFTIVLGFYLFYSRNPLVEAFAAITSFKYGIWAISMIVAGAWFQFDHPTALQTLQTIEPLDWMLVISHGGMAFEVLFFSRYFTFNMKHLAIAAIWTLLNDLIDYGFDMHPWLPGSLSDKVGAVAVFTVILSIVSIILFTISIRWQQKRA